MLTANCDLLIKYRVNQPLPPESLSQKYMNTGRIALLALIFRPFVTCPFCQHPTVPRLSARYGVWLSLPHC